LASNDAFAASQALPAGGDPGLGRNDLMDRNPNAHFNLTNPLASFLRSLEGQE
jgi:hypothetical protein